VGFLLLEQKKIIHDIVMRFKVFTAVRINTKFFCDVMRWTCQDIKPHKFIPMYNYEVVSAKLMHYPTYAFTLLWCRFTPGSFSRPILQYRYTRNKIKLSVKYINFIGYFSIYVYSSNYRESSH